MRMQDLLSKSKNPYYYEAGSEGDWTVDDARSKFKDPSRMPLRVKEPVVDPMDPAFNLQESSDFLRGKKNHVPDAGVKQEQRENHDTVAASQLGSTSPVSSGSRSGTRSRSGSRSGSGT